MSRWVSLFWLVVWGLTARAQVAPPTIVGQPVSPAGQINLGNTFSLGVQVSGEGPISYQWQLNGLEIPGATLGSLSFPSFAANNGGAYRVRVSNAGGSVYSQIVRLIPALSPLPFSDNFDVRNLTTKVASNAISGTSGIGRGSNFGATVQRAQNEPKHAGAAGGASVWVWWTAPDTGIATLSTEGSDFDTVLAVYRAIVPKNPNPNVGELTEVESNDNEGKGVRTSKLRFNAHAKTTYFIAIDGQGGVSSSLFATRASVQRGSIVFKWDLETTAFLLPEFTSILQNLNVPLAQVLQISASVDPVGAASTAWQWNYNGAPLAGANSVSLTIPSLSREKVGTYFCDVTTASGPTVRTARSKTVDVQIYSRSDHADSQILAQDSFNTAADYTFGPGSITRGAPIQPSRHRQPHPLGLAGGASGTQIFNTSIASVEEGEPVPCGISGGRSEWYTIQANSDGQMVVDTIGSDYDTVLAAYYDNGTGTGLFDGLVNVACNNDAPGLGQLSRVTFPSVAGRIYFIQIDGVNGAGGIAQLNFRLGPGLRIDQQPANVTVQRGNPASLSVAATGAGPVRYQWKKGGLDIPGATASAFSIASAGLADNGVYSVSITDDVTSTLSNSVTLTVLNSPEFITQPISIIRNLGETASFTIATSGSPAPTIQWLFNGSPLPGKTEPTLLLVNVQLADAGQYSAVASNSSGTTNSTVATLAIQIAPTFILQPVSATKNQGEAVTFTVAATGNPTPTIQWLFNGNPLGGKTDPTLSLPNVQLADAGQYFAVATSSAGTTTSTAATLSVQVPPAFTLQPVSATKNQGDTVTFTVTATGNPTPTIQWLFNDNPLSGKTDPTFSLPNVQLSNAGQYSAVATSSAGTTKSTVATLNVQVPPAFTTQPISAIRNPGDAVTFTVAATGNPNPTIQWLFNGNPLSGKTDPTLSFSNVQVSDAGQYTALARNSVGTVTSVAATLTIRTPPAFSTQPESATRAIGETVTFTVATTGNPAPAIQWFFNDKPLGGQSADTLVLANVQLSNAGRYTAVANNAVGSVTSSGAILTVHGTKLGPTITLQPENLLLDLDEDAIFEVGASGTPPISFQWRKNGQNLFGETSEILELDSIRAKDVGQYSVVVSNPTGSVTSSLAELRIRPATPTGIRIRQLSKVEIEITGQGMPGQNFRLQQSTDFIHWNTLPQAPAPSGTIKATVPTSGGRPFSIFRMIPTLPGQIAPRIILQPESLVLAPGAEATFEVDATGTPAPAYQWQRNGQDIVGANTETFELAHVNSTNAGQYSVIISNPAGSVVSAAVELEVNSVLTPSIHIRLTPNHLIEISGQGNPDLDLQLEYSTDFIHWIPVAATATPSGSIRTTIPAGSGPRFLVYRMVAQ